MPFLTLLGVVLKRSTSRMSVSIWAIATITVALAGPFGTFSAMSTAQAIAYWALVIGLSILVSNLVVATLDVFLGDWPRARLDLIAPVFFSVIYTPMLHLVGGLFPGPEAAVVLSFWQCLLIVLVVAYAGMLLQRIYRTGDVRADMAMPRALDKAPVPARSRPRLLERINGAADARVLRVTVDDHYVIVHLQGGVQHRLLMRFADAVAELDGIEGFFTHRSHWVADGAVVRVLRKGRREIALLVNGAAVPVSRTYRDNLVRRGLVSDRTISGKAAVAE